MKAIRKALVAISLFFMVIFICVGYASITDSLVAAGNADIAAPVYEEMVIADLQIYSQGTTAYASSNNILYPANISTTITGSAGQKVVYRVVLRNNSPTATYVYRGAFYSEEYESVGKNLDITTSIDADNVEQVPAYANDYFAVGTPVAPNEDIVFYLTYTLTSDMSAENILVNLRFEEVIYSVIYLVDNTTYAVDCIYDNSQPYLVRDDGPDKGSLIFADWVNASAEGVHSYPAGNTMSYTLSAKWDNVYLIIFVDNHGNVIYEETFTSSSKKLSDEGQAIIDAKLAEMNAAAAIDNQTVVWESYDISKNKQDTTVRPIYIYNGNLRFTPIDEDMDGITDYYQLDAVDKLDSTVTIPGSFNGLPVKDINKLYDNNGNYDFSSGVNTIVINEGVENLNHNSLAYTSNLNTVYLPHSIKYMNKNVFSRNTGDDKKVLNIYFNGTMAEWQSLVNASHDEWHNGLKTGSRVHCSDGYYELKVSGFIWYSYTWTPHPN